MNLHDFLRERSEATRTPRHAQPSQPHCPPHVKEQIDRRSPGCEGMEGSPAARTPRSHYGASPEGYHRSGPRGQQQGGDRGGMPPEGHYYYDYHQYHLHHRHPQQQQQLMAPGTSHGGPHHYQQHAAQRRPGAKAAAVTPDSPMSRRSRRSGAIAHPYEYYGGPEFAPSGGEIFPCLCYQYLQYTDRYILYFTARIIWIFSGHIMIMAS